MKLVRLLIKGKLGGSKYIKNLTNDLKEYGKGYSIQNLYRMSLFASEFNKSEILSHPVREIQWSTLTIIIMTKSFSHEEL